MEGHLLLAANGDTLLRVTLMHAHGAEPADRIPRQQLLPVDLEYHHVIVQQLVILEPTKHIDLTVFLDAAEI